MLGTRRSGLGAIVSGVDCARTGYTPWRAAEEVDGDWEKVSRSRRIADDCFRAELKREFYCP